MVDGQRQDIELLGTLVQGILRQQWRDIVLQGQDIHVRDIGPCILLFEMADRGPFFTDGDMAVGKGHYLFAQPCLQPVMQVAGRVVLLPLLMLELEGNIHPESEEPLRQGLDAHRFLPIGILLEILEIPAPVEDIEAVLILAAKDTRAQTGIAANHLPELDLALDDLEEHQVQDVRYVDARIQHIYGNGYLRLSIPDFELVDEVLRIGDVVVDEDAEPRSILGIQHTEPLDDELGMAVVVGKDDGFADTFPALHFQAVFNEVLQDGIDRILIEDIAENLIPGDVPVVISGGRMVNRIAAALNKAVVEGLIPSNPFKTLEAKEKPKKDSVAREFLTIEELKVLIKTPCRYEIVKKAFLFSCFTGLRYSDVKSLRWSEIHTAADGKTLYIEHDQVKTKSRVTIPLSDETLKWMPKREKEIDLVYHELRITATTVEVVLQ